jgi:hypothetical protein
MTTATATTVTIDREALMALLVEAEALTNVVCKIVGDATPPLTEPLDAALDRVEEAVLGSWPDDGESGPRFDLDQRGHERARELLWQAFEDVHAG